MLQENNGLIWSVVRRYYGRGVEPDDLYQLGCLGFLKAVRGFDPAYGTQFSTYAVPKIAGEIRRFLRDDGPVKVSRGLKERGAAIRGAGCSCAPSWAGSQPCQSWQSTPACPRRRLQRRRRRQSPRSLLQAETGEGGLTLEGMLTAGGEEEGWWSA